MKAKYVSLVLATLLSSTFVQAESLEELGRRSQEAANILQEVVGIPDHAIPNSLLEKSVCVATIPNVVRIGFVFGARYGKGLVSCRVPGGWSKPSFVQITGGSWGAQIGIESIDLVLVFVRMNAVDKFSKDNFTVGVDATVAAGPIGRDAQAGTDYQLNSEIYSYSKTKGLFAGLTIEGTVLGVNRDDNAQVYGNVSAYSLLTYDGRSAPATVTPYVNALVSIAH